MSSDGPSCEVEAYLLSTYLLGSPATPVLVERYTRACATLFTDTPPADTRLLRLAGRFPWLLGPIDAGVALLRPDSVVRKKLLLMSAILEATPEHADRFLPRPASKVGLAALLAGVGLKTAIQVPIGAAIIWATERSR